MRKREKIALGVLLAFVLVALASGILGNAFSSLQANKKIPNSGAVRGIKVGIYWDLACTNQTSSIGWGLLDPGSNKTVTVYVRNEGNTVATLSKATQNWNPSTASTYLTLNWNYAGQILSVNQVLQVKLTLVVSSSVSGITTFNFDTTITATG